MTFNLKDVKNQIEKYEVIWKFRVVSAEINLDIDKIPATEINFRTLIPGSNTISGISIRNNTNSSEFSFYASDINPEKIEIKEGLITIQLKSGAKILFFCTQPTF
ncbi:hypothetical protein [Paenibacillus sp. HB172176]|uniref:hypothetical protein n=1 Tax=Paenibacillus sp. HB172176 TaxID=2493690 RepID=UPI001438FDAD|nr:hypothetical protein [Paenibacillus sp. HB172176]